MENTKEEIWKCKARYLGNSCLKDSKGKIMDYWECGNCGIEFYTEKGLRKKEVKCRNCIFFNKLANERKS